LALKGGFFAERDGDGDEPDATAPFVWIPGGAGRLGLGGRGMTGGGTAVTEMGAIAALATGDLATVHLMFVDRRSPLAFTERHQG